MLHIADVVRENKTGHSRALPGPTTHTLGLVIRVGDKAGLRTGQGLAISGVTQLSLPCAAGAHTCKNAADWITILA
jgi:hypothetical protein